MCVEDFKGRLYVFYFFRCSQSRKMARELTRMYSICDLPKHAVEKINGMRIALTILTELNWA